MQPNTCIFATIEPSKCQDAVEENKTESIGGIKSKLFVFNSTAMQTYSLESSNFAKRIKALDMMVITFKILMINIRTE